MKPSELILNPDGSVYHLGLKPGDCAPVIITVGDPNRVSTVAQYFDTIIFSHQTREIHTQTGMLSGRPISVISTGMGTDNIDIVLNELDALFNMDLQSGTPSPTHTQLTFIRLGTSGAIQSDVPTDSIIVAQTAIGFDNLLHYYDLPTHPMAKALFLDRIKAQVGNQNGFFNFVGYAVSFINYFVITKNLLHISWEYTLFIYKGSY